MVFLMCRKHLTGCGIRDLFKLKQLGIDGDVLKWVSNYLDNRQQRVAIKSCKSSFRSTNADVPQGSVLGLLLFLIYINDIAESLGVVGWCEGAVYLTSLGRPTDIGLQLGKACYPCSG